VGTLLDYHHSMKMTPVLPPVISIIGYVACWTPHWLDKSPCCS